jgi:HSP20 family protein
MGDFDGLVNGFLSPVRRIDTNQGQVIPAMDIVENEEGYVVKADLPGIKKEDLNVTVKDNLLNIEAGSSSEEVEKEGESVIKLERRSGKYQRSLRLGKTINESAIKAQYVDGVLTLTLPRAEAEKSRKIEVAVH